jgi:hypothetical protein
VGLENDLFHNHVFSRQPAVGSQQPADSQLPATACGRRTKALHFRYPLIQYKVLGRQAAIVGLGKGAAALRAQVSDDGLLFAGLFPIACREDENFRLDMSPDMQPYYLCQWLALNRNNYDRWKAMEHPVSRKMELERILAAHILAFAEGVHFDVPRPRGLVVEILETSHPMPARCHGNRLTAFDVRFTANIHLPLDAGLGKAASHGFGCVWEARRFIMKLRPKEALNAVEY